MHKVAAQTQLKRECKLADLSEVIQNVAQRGSEMENMKEAKK